LNRIPFRKHTGACAARAVFLSRSFPLFLVVLAAMLVQAALVIAQDPITVYPPTSNVKFTWTAASGNPEFYNVHFYDNGVESVTTTEGTQNPSAPEYPFVAQDGHTYQIQVQAADSLGNTGLWSGLSPTYAVVFNSVPADVLFVDAVWSVDWLNSSGGKAVRCVIGNLPSAYDVRDIDTSVLTLNAIPVPIIDAKLRSNGYPGFSNDRVLIVRIPVQPAVAALGTTTPGTYMVTVGGKFTNGEAFAGQADVLLEATSAAPTRPLPQAFAVGQNYPNTFNPETWIPYALPEDAEVALRIYDAAGKLVRYLDLGYREAGYYDTRTTAAYWDGSNDAGEEASSGVYFYVLEAGTFTGTRKMVMRK